IGRVDFRWLTLPDVHHARQHEITELLAVEAPGASVPAAAVEAQGVWGDPAPPRFRGRLGLVIDVNRRTGADGIQKSPQRVRFQAATEEGHDGEGRQTDSPRLLLG